jgi:lactoylglutathione lyase
MFIQHVAIWVHDLEVMKEFYQSNFHGHSNNKYVNLKTGFSSYFIRFDEGVALELMNRPDVCKAGGETLGYAHVAFALEGRSDVDVLTGELCSRGFTVVSGPRTTGDGCYESCILDPEGNKVEITC